MFLLAHPDEISPASLPHPFPASLIQIVVALTPFYGPVDSPNEDLASRARLLFLDTVSLARQRQKLYGGEPLVLAPFPQTRAYDKLPEDEKAQFAKFVRDWELITAGEEIEWAV